MNILLISPIPPPAGGIASWTKRFVEYSTILEEHKVLLVNTAVIGQRIHKLQKGSFAEETKRTIKILANLIKSIKSTKISVAHLNSSCGRMGIIRDLLCSKIVKFYRIPLVTHFRCDVSYMIRNRISLFFLKMLVKNSDSVITLNTSSYSFVKLHCNKESNIIPNFLSSDYVDIAKKEKHIKEKIERIIYVGHISKAKGCDLLIQLAKIFSDYEFILVGSVMNDIKAMSLTDNIKIVDEIPFDQVITELNKADLFLFPSLTEGFPNSVSEAMACGMPIIATPVGAIPDMIEGKGGLLVEINDLNGFEKAITELDNSKETRAFMSNWNRNKAGTEYSIDKVYQRLINHYEQIQ